MTVWKRIKGFPGYSVSSDGEVKSLLGKAPRILKPSVNKVTGYAHVNLRLNKKPHTRLVHILVCEAFHGPKPTPTHEVNHDDGVKRNNSESNLGWVTKGENMLHARRVLKRMSHLGKFGAKNHLSKTYKVVTPEGDVAVVTGLRDFCRKQNIDVREMSRLASKGLINRRHKGWSCAYC